MRVIGRFADLRAPPDKPALVVVTASMLLAFSLMLSQAMESVTRAFYARADLELILSSPVAAAAACSRCASPRMALSTTLLGLVLAAPFIDVLAYVGGAALARGLWRGGGDRRCRPRRWRWR